jgi:hypothetical protein
VGHRNPDRNSDRNNFLDRFWNLYSVRPWDSHGLVYGNLVRSRDCNLVRNSNLNWHIDGRGHLDLIRSRYGDRHRMGHLVWLRYRHVHWCLNRHRNRNLNRCSNGFRNRDLNLVGSWDSDRNSNWNLYRNWLCHGDWDLHRVRPWDRDRDCVRTRIGDSNRNCHRNLNLVGVLNLNRHRNLHRNSIRLGVRHLHSNLYWDWLPHRDLDLVGLRNTNRHSNLDSNWHRLGDWNLNRNLILLRHSDLYWDSSWDTDRHLDRHLIRLSNGNCLRARNPNRYSLCELQSVRTDNRIGNLIYNRNCSGHRNGNRSKVLRYKSSVTRSVPVGRAVC